jgi:hypothetical protein
VALGALLLQVALENVVVAVGLLEALALNGLDALQQLAAVEGRLGAAELARGSRRRFAFGEGESVGADAESPKIRAGDIQINFIAPGHGRD